MEMSVSMLLVLACGLAICSAAPEPVPKPEAKLDPIGWSIPAPIFPVWKSWPYPYPGDWLWPASNFYLNPAIARTSLSYTSVHGTPVHYTVEKV